MVRSIKEIKRKRQNWKDGNRTGEGKYVYESGTVYQGDFKNNSAEGNGVIVYAGGDTYKGEFLEGVEHGKGVYKFEYCLFNPDEDIKYLIENHLICIHYKEELDSETLLEKYNEIINSLNDERTKLFVKYYFGNNAINTKELSYILPIYT